MKVLKFGGTSVGSVENMRAVMQLIADGNQKLVVLSAMSGTTNSLIEIANYLQKKNKDAARQMISQLEQKYNKVVTDLYQTSEKKEKGKAIVSGVFQTIKSFTSGEFNEVGENTVVAQGELLSTALFAELMLENGYKTVYLSALDFMKIDSDKAADSHFIRENIARVLQDSESAGYYITQGFICRNTDGNIDNLQRGGSDYTATLIGAAIDSEEVEIWTDIDGFHNNDPRFVENTKKIDQLSFDEAAELAYFGAKILHPQTVLPAKLQNIPVRLKNTMNPTDAGTLITAESAGPAQGGQAEDLGRLAGIHRAPLIREVHAPAGGVVGRVDAGMIGQAAVQLGAGRARASDGVDFAVGFDRLVKTGEPVRFGQPLCRIHARTAVDFDMAEAMVERAIRLED